MGLQHQARPVGPRLPIGLRGTAALALGALLWGCGGISAPSGAERQAAGAITVVETAQFADMLSAARGAVVVVNFWATWCPPCVKEMPELSRFYTEYSAKGVAFLSVSVDHPDLIGESVRPFVKKHALPFTVLVLNESEPAQVGTALAADWDGAVPATFVFDKDGALRKAWYEEIALGELAGAVDPLLG